MKKILLALFALALVVAFTAPSYAADFKMTGLYQVRGSSDNVNKDGDEDLDDSDNYLQALIRPRFTVKAGAVTTVWEPEFASPHNGFVNNGRQPVGVNRWVIDFAVPGSALRMRWGKTDYTSPDKEIFDSGGSHRWPGASVYGKLNKNMSLSMFYTKKNEGRGHANADEENYYAGVSIKVSPNLTLSPWVANTRNKERSTKTDVLTVNPDGSVTGETTTAINKGYDYTLFALHAKAKMGIFNLNATVVGEDGEIDGTDLSGWALLVRTSTSLGKLKLEGNLTMLSGDDDADDNESNKFAFPSNNGSSWLMGSHIMSSKRWDSITNGLKDTTLKNFNGAVVIEGVAEYALTKTFSLGGGVSVYNSAEAKGADYSDATEFGTEINAGFKWKIHPGLELRAVGAVILRGDYGVKPAADGSVTTPDDGWSASWRLRHTF